MIKIGEKFSNFLIQAEIGKGGMGTIYYAIDTMLNREVALKIVHPQLAFNAQLMERFKIEAMTQARMNHPQIVMIFSFNKIENDFVIVMEYVDGKSLKEMLLERKVLHPQEAIQYVEQVLHGLQYAHAHNVVHRDIKPANILINRDNRVKLSDFGIAKVLGSQGLTKTGMLVGTPWYTSPEQILGREIDFRTDLYSLGITFYEMVTGRVPFDSETNSEFQIQKAHLETPPPRPSIFNPEIGLKVEKYILKALQKSVDKRYQNAAEMLDELQRLKGQITEIRPPTITSREVEAVEAVVEERPAMEQPVRRRASFFTPLRLVGMAIGVLALFLLIMLFSWWSGKSELPPVGGGGGAPAGGGVPAVSGAPAGGDVPVGGDVPAGGASPTGSAPTGENGTGTQTTSSGSGSAGPVTVTTGTPKDQGSISTGGMDKTLPTVNTKGMSTAKQLGLIRDAILNQNLPTAEALADDLLRREPSAAANSLAGTVKMLQSKFSEAEANWQKAISGNASITLVAAHRHAMEGGNCLGSLILRQRMIIFNSRTRPDHSFVLTLESIHGVSRSPTGAGIEIAADVNGRQLQETFSLTLRQGRTQKENFIAQFINRHILKIGG